MKSFLNFITKILPLKTLGGTKHIRWLSAGQINGKVILIGQETNIGGPQLTIFESEDGINFSPTAKKIKLVPLGRFAANITKDRGFRLSVLHDEYYLNYVTKKGENSSLALAKSSDGEKFSIISEIDSIEETGQIVPNFRFHDTYVLYYGQEYLRVAFSKDLNNWQEIKDPILSPRNDFFDHKLEIMGSIVTDKGILAIYDCSKGDGQNNHIQCGGVLFSHSDPGKVIWRSEIPIFKEVTDKGIGKPLGVVFEKDNMFLYWSINETDLLISSIPMPFSSKVKDGIKLLKRHPANPIISPDNKHDWEAEGTFNSAAIYLNGKVHIIYRAVGRDGISSFGYAESTNGYEIDNRLDSPIFYPGSIKNKPANYKDLCSNGLYSSGGSWGGCEDPKLTKIDGRIYMTYVVFNGYEPQRVAITSISEKNFLDKNWDWEEPVMMSAPDVINKSACLLPEKIENKYVIFHRIFPDILIDYVDDLKFENNNWLKGNYKIPARSAFWDSRKLSVGATPIKTDLGWLVIYHAIDDRDPSRYKIGAMILDYNDLSKVLYRTNQPILVPEAHYENDGKPGVVYPSGAVVLNDELYVYYGGGDKVVCVATTPMKNILNHLQSSQNKQHVYC